MLGQLALGAFVVGLFGALFAETMQHVEKIDDPSHKQHQHQPVDPDDELVNGQAIGRGQFGHEKKITGNPFVHTLVESVCGAAGLAIASLLRIR